MQIPVDTLKELLEANHCLLILCEAAKDLPDLPQSFPKAKTLVESQVSKLITLLAAQTSTEDTEAFLSSLSPENKNEEDK